MYEAIPFSPRPQVIGKLLRSIAGHDTAFNDFQKGCDEGCYREKPVPDMCPECQMRMAIIARSLVRENSLAWEVWQTDAEMPELVGLIRVSQIVPGVDAVGHYVFFDGDLRGKTEVLQAVIDWLFEDHEEEGWRALGRLTVEIPDFAFALARHAHKRLSFGGQFTYKPGKNAVAVEGVKENAVPWRGSRRDLLVLGLRNEALEQPAA